MSRIWGIEPSRSTMLRAMFEAQWPYEEGQQWVYMWGGGGGNVQKTKKLETTQRILGQKRF